LQSDEQLIRDMQQGVQSAMEIFIKRHYNLVFAYIYRYCGDYHMAYDLTQETFIKMVRSIATVIHHENAKLWLLKVALNTCRDYSRSRASKLTKASNQWEENFAAASGAGQPDPFEQTVENAVVKEAVMALPDYQRETIILRFYKDLKIKEIASLTDVGEPTVKSRIKQGLSKLKGMMERGKQDDNKER